MQVLELHRVPHSFDIEKPGDFALVPKREPIREITPTPIRSRLPEGLPLHPDDE